VSRPDLPTLVAGVAIATLGALLLADGLGDLELRFGLITPACLAAVGAILLASGLSRRP
jgi:hypothetical protein